MISLNIYKLGIRLLLVKINSFRVLGSFELFSTFKMKARLTI